MTNQTVNTPQGYELDWNATIENDSSFTLLPPGDYDFTVTKFERARHNGSEKLPACNKAIVYLSVHAPEGDAELKHSLFLHSRCEGMLCAFFSAIGQRRHGEKLQMDWNKVVGAKGRVKLAVREWKNQYGETMQSNDIKKFIEPAPNAAPSFVPGAF